MTWNDWLIALWPAVVVGLLFAFAGYLASEDRPAGE
jgi:hypothetical protein